MERKREWSEPAEKHARCSKFRLRVFSYFTLVAMINTYNLISRMIAVIQFVQMFQVSFASLQRVFVYENVENYSACVKV